MDSFLTGIIVYIAVISIPFVAIWIYRDRKTVKLLVEHQKEWNEIKAYLSEEDDVEEAYIAYCEELTANRDWLCGACFPRPEPPSRNLTAIIFYSANNCGKEE